MTTITLIPAEIAQVVRSAVLCELGTAASDIDRASLSFEKEQHPDRFQEPLERFDALRALVETIGWSNVTVPIEIDEHGQRLAHILKERIELDREHVNELHELAAERESIEEDIANIEDFLAAKDED